MADSKVSDLAPSTNVLATDAWHVARAGGDFQLTAGVFAANLPFVGNRGYTKYPVVSANPAPSALPLIATNIRVATGTYTLGQGQDGQEIRILFTAPGSVVTSGQGFTQINGSLGSTVTLLFDVNKWFILSSYQVTTESNI